MHSMSTLSGITIVYGAVVTYKDIPSGVWYGLICRSQKVIGFKNVI